MAGGAIAIVNADRDVGALDKNSGAYNQPWGTVVCFSIFALSVHLAGSIPLLHGEKFLTTEFRWADHLQRCDISALLNAQPQADFAGTGHREGMGGLPARRGPTVLRRGLHPSDSGLAGVRPGRLLAVPARLPRSQCPERPPVLAPLLLERRSRDAMSSRGDRSNPAHRYAHHTQRLMVTGVFALLLGVEPRQVHEWYLTIYVDAVG